MTLPEKEFVIYVGNENLQSIRNAFEQTGLPTQNPEGGASEIIFVVRSNNGHLVHEEAKKHGVDAYLNEKTLD